MENGRVMIVGAGIGGLTAAVALERAGREVVVFERAPELLEVGAGFTMNSNAVLALREVGLDRIVEERGVVLEKFDHRTQAGKLITSWPTGNIGRNLGAPIVGLSRPEMQRILYDSLGSADVRFGHEVTEILQDESGVTARFSNGGEERGAALVGGDGSESTVRALFDQTERRYSGYTTWLAISGRKPFAPGTHTQWYGKQRIFGAHPVGGERTYWYASWSVEPGQRGPDPKQEVLELFRDWHDEIAAIIEETDVVNRSDIYDLPRRDSWATGRVSLLGDAAHSMVPALGQGACQAIEDGVVLARHLNDASADQAAALRAYERARIERTAPIVRRARMQGKLMQGDNALIRLARYGSFRFAPTSQVLKSFQKLLTFEP